MHDSCNQLFRCLSALQNARQKKHKRSLFLPPRPSILLLLRGSRVWNPISFISFLLRHSLSFSFFFFLFFLCCNIFSFLFLLLLLLLPPPPPPPSSSSFFVFFLFVFFPLLSLPFLHSSVCRRRFTPFCTLTRIVVSLGPVFGRLAGGGAGASVPAGMAAAGAAAAGGLAGRCLGAVCLRLREPPASSGDGCSASTSSVSPVRRPSVSTAAVGSAANIRGGKPALRVGGPGRASACAAAARSSASVMSGVALRDTGAPPRYRSRSTMVAMCLEENEGA